MYSSFVCLLCMITLTHACTKIVISSSDNDLSWIKGTFVLEPTLVADGRPVWIEENPSNSKRPRFLYHYSHAQSTDTNATAINYETTDFSGRWILGHDMYSADGWSYLPSWSISPADILVSSLVQMDDKVEHFQVEDGEINPKLQWLTFRGNAWSADRFGAISLACDSIFDDPSQDWLFVHTPNRHQFNILNADIASTDADRLLSITQETLYGFYYRISADFYHKIESKMFFRKRDLKNSPLQTDAERAWFALLGDSNDNVEYSFFVYANYTDERGVPDLHNFDGYKVVTYASSAQPWDEIRDKQWFIVRNTLPPPSRQRNVESVAVHIVSSDRADNIYSAFRRYWTQRKLQSFESVTSNLSAQQRKKLLTQTNNGLPFMMLGLGTGGLRPKKAEKAQRIGLLDVGYRLIDGAEAYENEASLGEILAQEQAVVERDDVFVISKVWPTHLGFVQTYQVMLDSLNKLKSNYFDLYMIHWKECNPKISWMHCEVASNRPWQQSYQIMEKLYAEGILLNLGVSNFDFRTFTEQMINKRQVQIIPQVLQNYFDVAHADWDLAHFVRRFGVIYQGYAQYRGIAEAEERYENGETHYAEFKDALERVSQESTNGLASASQVLLRWLLDMNIAVIPRSRQRTHLEENWNVWDFELSVNDIDTLTALSKEQNRRLRKKQEL